MSTDRMVLRAELFHESQHIVAHTTKLTPRSAFVCTEERLEVGARVQLRLSFPTLLDPVDLAADVVARHASSGHGYNAGFALSFVGDSHEPRLESLLAAGEDGARAASTEVFRILVVEDSAVMRDLMQHTGERFSSLFRAELDSTDTAEHALELVAQRTYDLGIVDHYLGGKLTGADLVRDIRARGLGLPLIGVSIGGRRARDAFLGAGADLYLDKPITVRDVFATLERLVLAARRKA